MTHPFNKRIACKGARLIFGGLACVTLGSSLVVTSSGCAEQGRVPKSGPGGGGAGGRGASGESGNAGDGDAGSTSAPPCAPVDPTSLAACAEKARYVADLNFIAGERTPGSAHWRAVQGLCSGRFTELGYDVELQAYPTGVNVIGVRRGTQTPEKMLLISAHYDSVPNCAGADDNGSGVAGVLEAARLLAMRPHARTVAVACWDEEERRSDDISASGSGAYAKRARERGATIVGNFVLEMIGYATNGPNTQRLPPQFGTLFPTQVERIRANENRGDFLAVILDPASHSVGQRLAAYAQTRDLPIVLFEVPANLLDSPATGNLRRSDHASFWANGYPGMMLTDTAEYRNEGYHCQDGRDEVDTLDHDFAIRVVRATTAAAARTLEEP